MIKLSADPSIAKADIDNTVRTGRATLVLLVDRVCALGHHTVCDGTHGLSTGAAVAVLAGGGVK